MSLGLSTIGLVSYNGYVFDSTLFSRVREEVAWDEANRSTQYRRLVFDFRFTVAIPSGATTDAYMLDLRKRLLQVGKAFVYTGQGYGNDLKINLSGGQRDIKFGPKPQFVEWSPIASNKAAEVSFQLVVVIACCPKSFDSTPGVLGLNYSIDFDINEKGFTTRTTTGYVEIGSFANGQTPVAVADSYRNYISISRLEGFNRTTRWSNGLDKTRLQFTIVDQQIESKFPLPQYMIHADGHHRVNWSRGSRQGMVQRHTIGLSIEHTANASLSQIMNAFAIILNKRLNICRNNGFPILLDDVTIDEAIFGTALGISVSYRVLASLGDLVTNAGLFVDPGTSWASWKSTTADLVQTDRGLAGLTLQVGEDAIFDPCVSSVPSFNTKTPNPISRGVENRYVFTNVAPPVDKSWIEYLAYLDVVRESPLVRQSASQTSTYEDSASADMNRSEGLSFNLQSNNLAVDVLQAGGQPVFYAHFFGQARRAGYKIPRPRLLTIGGVTATEKKGNFLCKQAGNQLGVPVYEAAWDILYYLPQSPGQVELPQNFYERMDKDGNAYN